VEAVTASSRLTVTALVKPAAKVTSSPADASSKKLIVVIPAAAAFAPRFRSISRSEAPVIVSTLVMLVKSVSTRTPSAVIRVRESVPSPPSITSLLSILAVMKLIVSFPPPAVMVSPRFVA
jgi:hypothetical protein